jgi:hypothetical protein
MIRQWGTVNCGHYTAAISALKGNQLKWFKCDDANVGDLSESDVEAYRLYSYCYFFRRRK